jgi:hypothetical protein
MADKPCCIPAVAMMDPGRARVIVAGHLAVLRITAFSCTDPTVCLSDLLEGRLLEEIEGERHA